MVRSSQTRHSNAHPSTLSLFQRDWRIYRAMVDENYLFHREVYACLHGVLAEAGQGPFRFLDIACGDAASSAAALERTRVAAYHGIDLSAEALALAERALSGLPCPVTLEQGDFVEVLRGRAEPADVVWIGLSLHHLRHHGKGAVLKDARRLLSPGGLLILYENTSPDGEDRTGWLARWDRQRPAWTAYSDADWNTMATHVHSADFPETCSGWRRLGVAAGFREVRELFVAPTDLFRMFSFK
jgi:SAM-dependent methyltransferase